MKYIKINIPDEEEEILIAVDKDLYFPLKETLEGIVSYAKNAEEQSTVYEAIMRTIKFHKAAIVKPDCVLEW